MNSFDERFRSDVDEFGRQLHDQSFEGLSIAALGFYVLAAAEDPELAALGDIDAAQLWFPAVKSVSVTTRDFDTSLLPEVEGLMQQAAEGITAEDWTPNASRQCERCSVRKVCPEWPEGKEAYLG